MFDDQVLYGQVVDEEKRGLPGVLVCAAALLAGGGVVPVALARTGQDGRYLLSFKRLSREVAGYRVAACKFSGQDRYKKL